MKIKAMVDGVEREVELTNEQMCDAFLSLQKHYDTEAYEENLDVFLDWCADEENNTDDLWDYMVSCKEQIVDAYRKTMDNVSDEWYFIMRNAVEAEARKYIESQFAK